MLLQLCREAALQQLPYIGFQESAKAGIQHLPLAGAGVHYYLIIEEE
jgi:hypothetical protein